MEKRGLHSFILERKEVMEKQDVAGVERISLLP